MRLGDYVTPLMLRRTLFLTLIAVFASTALADDAVEWQAIVVRFTIDRDGRLHVKEQVQVDVPPSVATLERVYWGDAEQQVTIDAITLTGERTVNLEKGNLDRAHHYDTPYNGSIQWSVRDKAAVPDGVRSYTYVIETTVADGVIPAWSIPRGKLSHDSSGQLGSVRERLRDILPVWRAAKENPRKRFLLDYQYEMPPPSTKGTTIQLQLYWEDGWTPVDELTPDTIAYEIDRDSWNPDRYRVTHFFDYSGGYGRPLAVDSERHATRMAALLGFPVAGLLLWLAFVAREALRRRLAGGGGEVDEQFVREAVYSEAPEVIGARWSGDAQYPNIEPFLRRLERDHKISIVIAPPANDEDDSLVSIRLLAPRERLTAYERIGIDALMPDGWETSSADIQRRHSGHSFDPANALHWKLTKITEKGKKSTKTPWYSQLTSFLLFIAGLFIAIQESVRLNREPAVFGAALISASILTSLWPRNLARNAIRTSLPATLLLLIPLLVAFAVIVEVHFAPPLPPGVYGSVGLALALFGTYKAILAASATRDSAEMRPLVRARTWLRGELRSATPRLRDEQIPWLTALGLGKDVERWRRRHQTAESRFASGSHWTGTPPKDEEEDAWGGALMTEAPTTS